MNVTCLSRKRLFGKIKQNQPKVINDSHSTIYEERERERERERGEVLRREVIIMKVFYNMRLICNIPLNK